MRAHTRRPTPPRVVARESVDVARAQEREEETARPREEQKRRSKNSKERRKRFATPAGHVAACIRYAARFPARANLERTPIGRDARREWGCLALHQRARKAPDARRVPGGSGEGEGNAPREERVSIPSDGGVQQGCRVTGEGEMHPKSGDRSEGFDCNSSGVVYYTRCLQYVQLDALHS